MLPCKEGISNTRHVYGDSAAGPLLPALRKGGTLAELQADYVLFNYAPLFVFGGLQHNPVQEWINTHNHQQIVFIFQMNKPILHIGAEAIWDQTLWAVEKRYWPSLAMHIGSIALLDRGQKKLTRAICQTIPVTDVAAVDRNPGLTILPTVLIHTFAIDSNFGCLAFAPATPLMRGRPYLKFHPPREETIKLAEALLANQTNPYNNVQASPWEKGTNESSDSLASSVGSGDQATP